MIEVRKEDNTEFFYKMTKCNFVIVFDQKHLRGTIESFNKCEKIFTLMQLIKMLLCYQCGSFAKTSVIAFCSLCKIENYRRFHLLWSRNLLYITDTKIFMGIDSQFYANKCFKRYHPSSRYKQQLEISNKFQLIFSLF